MFKFGFSLNVGYHIHFDIEILKVNEFEKRILNICSMFYFKERMRHSSLVKPYSINGRASTYQPVIGKLRQRCKGGNLS